MCLCGLTAQAGAKIAPLQLSFWAPLQVFGSDTDVVGCRVGVFYAENRNVTGIDVGTAFNYTKGNLRGFEFGGLNVVEKNAVAVMISPFWNWTMGKSRGAQITTIGINMADEGGFGIQASALMNNVGSDDASMAYHGIQLGLVNFGSVNGLQLSGFINGRIGSTSSTDRYTITRITEDSSGRRTYSSETSPGYSIQITGIATNGLQLAGLTNNTGLLNGIQASSLNNCATVGTGIQFCGIMNRGRESFTGIQGAAINSCDHMRGLQVGIINYTETLSGIQVGLVNIITKSPLPFFPGINVSW